ncbi:unnamed protein product [Haemonchus placei]|uniref:Transposase n=1 Tax=Haemonchus placei TaxID=6290 RepID=A0A0N4X3N3_HAEPC|nr:unnamed protein product [Haemonchus placei]
MDVAVLRYLQPAKAGHDEDQLFENRIWIPDIDLGYRLAAVLDDGLNDVLVGFRDEQGFFEKLTISCCNNMILSDASQEDHKKSIPIWCR